MPPLGGNIVLVVPIKLLVIEECFDVSLHVIIESTSIIKFNKKSTINPTFVSMLTS